MPYPSSIVVIHPSYQHQAKAFLDHLLLIGYNQHSARTKTFCLKEFLHFCETNGVQELRYITAQTIRDYYAYLLERPNKTTGGKLHLKTAYNHTRSIELFFIMLQTSGELLTNPTSTLKFSYPNTEGDIRNVLTQEEVKELYTCCNEVVERAILSLAYGCGLRVSELVNCNIEDIKLREGILIVPSSKFNKRRVVPVSAGVIKDLSDYFYQSRLLMEATEEKAFILNSKGRRMQKWTYNKLLKRLIERTQNKTMIAKEISIHNLRHSIATHLIEQKMPLEQVRLFLGHSQLETTELYTHISHQQLKEIIDDT